MEKYALVVDSTTHLSQKDLEDNSITRVSLNVIIGDKTYKELDIDNKFVFENLDKGISITTSQPSPGEFLAVYEDLLKQGYEKIFCLPITDQLSGTYQSAVLGKNMLDNPEDVIVINGKAAAFGNEIVTLEIARMIAENMDYDIILKEAEKMYSNLELVFTIENLTSLIKSGRLSKTKGLISTVMKIKPIIRMVNGKLEMAKAARTHKKVLHYILDSMKSSIKEHSKLHLRILNHDSEENHTILLEMVKEAFPKAIITINNYIGPIFSTHLGKKGYGVAWTTE